MNLIPREIVTLILCDHESFYNIQQVCKEWKAISDIARFWKEKELTQIENQERYRNVLKRSRYNYSQVLPSMCESGDYELVRILVNKGADVNFIPKKGSWTPLHYACDNNHNEIARFLIDKGANVDACTSYDYTALQAASHRENLELVELLISKGAYLDEINDDGNTALTYACEYGNYEIAKLLVDKGADINFPTRTSPPFYLACKGGNPKILQMLLDKQVNTNMKLVHTTIIPYIRHNLPSPLTLTAQHGNLEIVKMLLHNSRVVLGKKDNRAIFEACGKGYLEIVKLLLADSRIDPSARSNYCVAYASEKGHLEVVKLLLADPRVDPSDDKNEALIQAARNGHLEVVKLLLADPRDWALVQSAVGSSSVYRTELAKANSSRPRVNPNAEKNKAIFLASENKHSEVVRLLLKRCHLSDFLFIHDLLRRDHIQIVKILLEKPLNLDFYLRNRIFDWASSYGHLEIVKSLLNRSKELSIDPSFDKNSAIRSASEKGHSEVVKLLLADPRVDPSDKHNDAIRSASEKGHSEVVKLLLADPRVDPSADKNSAIRSASQNNEYEIVKLLLADPRVDPSDEDNRAIKSASLRRNIRIVHLLLTDSRVQSKQKEMDELSLTNSRTRSKTKRKDLR